MKKQNQLHAEDLNFWQTSRSSPDEWIARAREQIKGLGGRILAEAFGCDGDGRAAYILGFEIAGDRFKTVWPVVKSKSGNALAEKRQAATTLYHVVKAKCLEAIVRGPRVAFAGDLLLPSGRTVAETADPELAHALPLMLAVPGA